MAAGSLLRPHLDEAIAEFLAFLKRYWPLLLGLILSVGWFLGALRVLQPTISAYEFRPDGSLKSIAFPIKFDNERLSVRYRLTFSSFPGTPRLWQVIPDDDLRVVSVNGKSVSLAGFTPEQLQDWANGVRIDLGDYLQTGSNTMDVVLSNHSGIGGLDLQPVMSPVQQALLILSAVPLLAVSLFGRKRFFPEVGDERLLLLAIIGLGCAFRVWLVWHSNPMDHIWSDPQRHWEQGTDDLRMDPMSMIDPIGFQLYIAVLGKLTLGYPDVVAIYTALLSVLTPWLWYRFLRELLPSKDIALIGWAIFAWLPSWTAIYSYFMQETLMLPLLGGALWASWRSRRKGNPGSFLLAVMLWAAAGLTRGICIPMGAMAMSWVWLTQPDKLRRAALSLAALAIVLVPLSIRSDQAVNTITPYGIGSLVQLYQRSGSQEIVIDFKRDGARWTYGFTSPGILQAPFAPLSNWHSSRSGSSHFSIDLDNAAQSWADAKASIPWRWSKVARLGVENLVFLFFSESWPDSDLSTAMGRLNSGMRWLWAPLGLLCLVYTIRWRSRMPAPLLPSIILVWFLVQGVFPLSVNEGRYRKPFEGLLIAQCLLLASVAAKAARREVPVEAIAVETVADPRPEESQA